MPIAKSQLDYWDGSAWVTAETPSDNNALIRFTIEEKMGQAMSCAVKVSNRFNNPFSATQADFKGKLSGVFTDFQRIRVIDSATKVVLFYGRIYKTVEKYDLSFGNVIDIEAMDALAELKDMVTDGHDDINMTNSGDTFPTIASPTTAVGKRSGLIKGLISLFSKSGNITFAGDSNRFNESATTFSFQASETTGTYTLKKGGQKSVLAHINSTAKDDPHTSAKKVLTYDYYVDPNFQSRATNHEPASFFNYFKRGERPSSTPATYALRIEYPTGGGLTKTGRVLPMMADYDFSRPKDELFTDAVCHYVDEGPTTVSGATNKDKGFDVEVKLAKLELVKIKSISGSFVWDGKAIGGGTAGTDSAEEIKSGSTVVGRIQFMSATSGGSDSDPEYALVSDATSDFPSSGTITGATSTSSSFQIVTRNSVEYGINKTARLGSTNINNADVIREQAVARLRRSSDSILRGRIRIMSKPWYYLDSSSTTVSSNTITFGDLNPLSYGFRIGMTVNKVSSTGVVQSYGYATAVTSNSITVGNGMSASISTGDRIRLYVSVRASDSCYIINRLVNITGGNFQITDVNYTEDNGIISTELEIVGSNSGLGPPQNIASRLISAVSEQENYVQPKGGTAQSARAKLTSKFSHHTSNKHTTITWTVGQLTVGANAYAITPVGTQVFGSAGEHYLYYDTGGGTAGFGTSTVAAYTTNKDHVLVCWVNVLSTSDSTQWLEFKALGDLNTSVPDKGKASSTVNERTIKPTDKLTSESMEYFNADVVIKSAGNALTTYNTSGSAVTSFTVTFADGSTKTISGWSNPFATLGTTSGTSSNENVDNFIYADISSNLSLSTTSTHATAMGDDKVIIATAASATGGDAVVVGAYSAASGDWKRLNKALDDTSEGPEFIKNFEFSTHDTYMSASPVMQVGLSLPHGGAANYDGLHLAVGDTDTPLLFKPTLSSGNTLAYIQVGSSGITEDDLVILSNEELWLRSYRGEINVSSSTGGAASLNMVGGGQVAFVHASGNSAGFSTPATNPSTTYVVRLPPAVPSANDVLKVASFSGAVGVLEWGSGGTTYSAGTGLTLSGTTFSVTSGTYAADSHSHSYVSAVYGGYALATSGGLTPTLNHSTGSPYNHIPDNGGSQQVLTYYASGTATWQDASAHGTHGGSSYTHPDPIRLGSGTASIPTYSFSTDTDTGMYRYSNNAIGFSTYQVWKFVVDYAGTSYFNGNVEITGSIAKLSGTLKIPHPLDEENKTLVHGFVESPRYDLVYRGTVTLSDGTATASIDEASNNMTVGTFTALTKNPQVWAQNDTGWGAVKGRIENGNIIITAEDTTSSDTISWLVIAERNDTYINSSKEPWTDENGTFVPEWDTAALSAPPPF